MRSATASVVKRQICSVAAYSYAANDQECMLLLHIRLCDSIHGIVQSVAQFWQVLSHEIGPV